MTWSKYMHNPAANAKNLQEWFPEISAEDAKALAKYMKQGAGDRHSVDNALDTINQVIGGYGVEAIRGDYHVDNYYYDIVGLYVNTGDTYNATVVYDTERERFEVTTFGDWVEKNQKRYNII